MLQPALAGLVRLIEIGCIELLNHIPSGREFHRYINPQRAVSELQGNFRVFVVNDDGSVVMRAVEQGPQVGQMVLINSGLQSGEQVAIEGLLKLQDGATVKPKVVTFPPSEPSSDTAGS